MRPLIGLVPLVDRARESLWMLPGYMEGIEEAGGLPVMLPLTGDAESIARLVNTCAGFLLTGGQDVSPSVYGQARQDVCEECCPARDEMEKRLLTEAIRADRPVLGICRGIQILNAVLGGSLYQDLPGEHPSAVAHRMQPPYDRAAHTVALAEDTPLRRALGGAAEIGVNSCHHQAVRELAPSLKVMAAAPDGIVESVWMPGKRFVWAVQWHPEFSHRADENSRKIFRAFAEAAAESSCG